MSALYYYTARDARGAFIRGTVQASTRSAALSGLRSRELFITSLESGATARGTLASVVHWGGVSRKSLVSFFRSLSTLVRAGVPMRRALEVTVRECADSRLCEALRSVVSDIENGAALSDAFANRPREFPGLFVAMVKAGELGGVIDEVLERIASVLEREYAARKRLAASLTYPAVVAFTAIALVLFLVVTIVPMFRSMYEQLHVPLPAVTSLLISVGLALRLPQLWAAGMVACVLGIGAIARLRQTPRGSAAIEKALWSIPLSGAIARKAMMARLARMLGTLLRSGVALVPALNVVSDLAGSTRYRESLAELRAALKAGSLISDPLSSTGLYDALFLQMVRVGEETGSLDVMLLRAADYYELEVETMLGALGSALEPLLILGLGGAVGFIVSAVFIPLYTLIGNIK